MTARSARHMDKVAKIGCEEWRGIPSWDGLYEVSSLGRVRSLPRKSEAKNRIYGGGMVSALRMSTGYVAVNLTRRGKRQQLHIHRAVLLAFVGNPDAGQEACHNDGKRDNNALFNLRWDTRKANHADKARHGTRQAGEAGSNTKLKVEQVRRIKFGGESATRLVRELPVGMTQIYRIRHGVSWAEVTND